MYVFYMYLYFKAMVTIETNSLGTTSTIKSNLQNLIRIDLPKVTHTHIFKVWKASRVTIHPRDPFNYYHHMLTMILIFFDASSF